VRFSVPSSPESQAESDVAPEDCVPIYDTPEGDILCWHVPDGAGVWYPHEQGCLVRAGRLEVCLERFFELLCEGEEFRL
jgi:hypothetical protein